MSATIVDRGKAIIWSYQRLSRSTKSNISLKRSCTTGSTLLSSRDISTHCAQCHRRRVEFARFAARSDSRYERPKIGFSGVKSAPIPENGHRPDEIPCLQFPQRIGYIGAGDP